MKKLLKYQEFLLEQAQTATATPNPTTTPTTTAPKPDIPSVKPDPSIKTTEFQKGEKSPANNARESSKLKDLVDPGKLEKVSEEIDHEIDSLLSATIKKNEAMALLAAGIALALPKFIDVFGNFIQKIRNWTRELFGQEKLKDKNTITKFGEWLHEKMMRGLTTVISAIAKMFGVTLKDKTADDIALVIIWIAIAFFCAVGLAGVTHALTGLKLGELVIELVPTITKAYEIALAIMAIILYMQYEKYIKAKGEKIKDVLHHIEKLYEDKGKDFKNIKQEMTSYYLKAKAPAEGEQAGKANVTKEQPARAMSA